MNYAARIASLPDQLREFAEGDDYIREDSTVVTTVRASLMRAAAASIEADAAELTALRERQQADMGLLADATKAMRVLETLNAEFAAEVARLRERVGKLERAAYYVLEDEPSGIPRASSSCRAIVRAAINKESA